MYHTPLKPFSPSNPKHKPFSLDIDNASQLKVHDTIDKYLQRWDVLCESGEMGVRERGTLKKDFFYLI